MPHPYINLELVTDDPVLQQLCEAYWDHDEEAQFTHAVKQIAEQYNIRSHQVTELATKYCQASSIAGDLSCKKCGRPYTFLNRDDFRRQRRKATKKYTIRDKSWICEECAAIQIRREQEERQSREIVLRQIIANIYPLENRVPIDICNLTLRQAVFLLSVIRAGAAEGFDYIIAVWPDDLPLAPSTQYSYDMLRHLYREDLLVPHPQSPISAFEFEEDNHIRSFYLDKVLWSLPIGTDGKTSKEFLADLERIFREGSWPSNWTEDTCGFWKEIALQECIKYLTFYIHKHGLSFEAGEKTVATFESLLENYAVAQIYNFIWRATRDAAAFFMRENVTRKHAANTVVGSIHRQADRALSEKWEIKSFRRDFQCPRSMVSYIYFDTVLKIGDAGFNEPPHMVDIPTTTDN